MGIGDDATRTEATRIADRLADLAEDLRRVAGQLTGPLSGPAANAYRAELEDKARALDDNANALADLAGDGDPADAT